MRDLLRLVPQGAKLRNRRHIVFQISVWPLQPIAERRFWLTATQFSESGHIFEDADCRIL
jgi:hypothetical protein